MASKPARQDDIEIVVAKIKSRRGLIIVVSAPSGTGKTTLCERLVSEAPGVSLSVSFTTRKPRKGERDGVQYHFVSQKHFLHEREEGRFLEWAEVHGHYYGTPRDLVEKQVRAGKDTLLDIDVQGARAIKDAYREAILIFLVPPSFEKLESRLKGRKSEAPEEIQARLSICAREFSCHPAFDYLVLNENIDEAVAALHAIVKAERCRTARIKTARM